MKKGGHFLPAAAVVGSSLFMLVLSSIFTSDSKWFMASFMGSLEDCYFQVQGQSQMIHCTTGGCTFPDGSSCTMSGCTNPDGSPAGSPEEFKSRYPSDWQCRNADGSLKYSSYSEPSTGSTSYDSTYSGGSYPSGTSFYPTTNSYPTDSYDPNHSYPTYPSYPSDPSLSSIPQPYPSPTGYPSNGSYPPQESPFLPPLTTFTPIDAGMGSILEPPRFEPPRMPSETFMRPNETFTPPVDFRLEEMKRHLGESCRHLAGEIERLKQEASFNGKSVSEVLPALESLKQKCEAMVQEVLLEIEAGKVFDPRSLQERMHEIWREFENIMRSLWEHRSCEDVNRQIAEMNRNLEEEIPEFIAKVREAKPDVADRMEALRQRTLTYLEKAKQLVEEGKCDEALEVFRRMDIEINPQVDILMRESGMAFDDFQQYEDDYEDIYEHIGPEKGEFSREFLVEEFKKRDYGMKEIGLMKKVPREVLKEYFEHRPEFKGDLIEYGAGVDLKVADLERLLQAKNELLKEVQELKKAVSDLKREVADILEEVKSYNFGSVTSEKARIFVEQELPNVTAEIAKERLEDLKEEAREEKYQENIIPFLDTDDDQWFTIFAHELKNRGLMTGTGVSGGREFNPAGLTNLAEAITLFARVKGIDLSAVPKSTIGLALPDWARAAAGTLEQAGVDLEAIFGGKNPGDSVSRAEVAILLQEIMNLPQVDASLADVFSDIALANPAEKAAIASVKESGIMTGEGGTMRFNVKGPLNRAALAKIIALAASVLVEPVQ